MISREDMPSSPVELTGTGTRTKKMKTKENGKIEGF